MLSVTFFMERKGDYSWRRLTVESYDYLIVGAGLFGATFAHEMKKNGKKCLVIDRRDHVAGNIYTKKQSGIDVHVYGAHIFHTNEKRVWEFVNRFASFNDFINSPVANFRGERYHLPFNMNTFREMWGVTTADEARSIISSQIADLNIGEPENLEEQALKLVGRDVYEKLVKGYTQKQWGRPCSELPAFIIRRLPLRFEYDNNYFNAKYQGIPKEGYTTMVENMLEGVEVRTGLAYTEAVAQGISAKKTICTGMIDEFFDYSLGELEYRSLRFETKELDMSDFQGNAVVNYTDSKPAYTRIIEHKHFTFGKGPVTIVTKEYPAAWKRGDEPYYPVNSVRNNELYEKYKELAKKRGDVIFAGRLGEYRYYDMDVTVAAALSLAERLNAGVLS